MRMGRFWLVPSFLPSSFPPSRYEDMGLKDLCDEMFAFKKANKQADLLHFAYDAIPTPEMRPRDAFEKLMRCR